MAFTALTTQETAAGEPVKQELVRKVKDDFDDHESRLNTVEANTSRFQPFEFELTGMYSEAGAPQDRVLVFRVPYDCTLTGARLLIKEAGSSGTTEVDVEYKRGVGAWTTIFDTKPSVAFGAGDYALSSNAVLDVTDLLAGDLLALSIDAVQSLAEGATLYLEHEGA